MLAGCCGPEEAFHSDELQGAEGPRACTNFHPPPSSCTTPLSPRLHISASVLLFFILSLLLRGCRRRGTGLVLGHGAAASLGTTRGGPCEGGRPRGRPGLSRAPARTPPISGEPLRGAGGWEQPAGGDQRLVRDCSDGGMSPFKRGSRRKSALIE